MYPVNFTEKMSVNLTHAHTVCTRPSLSQREGPGDEATKDTTATKLGLMPQETIFTSFYEDLQVYMRNRYLALTNQITVFVTTMI